MGGKELFDLKNSLRERGKKGGPIDFVGIVQGGGENWGEGKEKK